VKFKPRYIFPLVVICWLLVAYKDGNWIFGLLILIPGTIASLAAFDLFGLHWRKDEQ
jgi:hypothetical protein